MAIQQYGTVASRNLIRAEMTMLKHAEPIQVLTKFGDQKAQPLNKTDTIVFRRLKPFNATSAGSSGYSETPQITAANFVTSEGVTPTANTISYTDVTTVLNQYAVLFKFSSKADLMYEDDIPGDMSKLTGETMAEVAELICYGQCKAGTNVVYANGSARTDVNTPVSLNDLRLATTVLESNRAKMVTTAIKSGEEFGVSSVEPGYICFMHTDLVPDVRDLAGFTKRVDYGSAIKPVHPREFGACEDYRFVTSPLFAPWLAGGADLSTSGMRSSAGSTVDVYPMIIIGESALGQCSLKGHGHTGISPTIIPASVKNHANPSGMFGYVGADFWFSSIRLNENWMTRIETGATDISG
jgi:N4-gp56 family major capsid protein